MDVFRLERFEDNSMHAALLLDHGDGLPLVTDDVEDCPHHTEGDQLSTLANLGDDYADLETDLIEVAALMCDLPEYEEELQRYVVDRIALEHTSARDVKVDASQAEAILEYLNRFQYGSRDHAIIALFWRTGMRLGALRTIDLEDLRPDDDAIDIHHRPETGTPLKNGQSGERWVWLGPVYYQILEDYVENNRFEVRDDHGREPLFTSQQGRLSESAVRDCCYRMTRPCEIAGCPHDREPATCEAVGAPNLPSKCPSARSPHAFRRGAITSHLNEGVPADVVSERMDVSLEVLYKHYDARRPDEKMAQRRKFLKDK